MSSRSHAINLDPMYMLLQHLTSIEGAHLFSAAAAGPAGSRLFQFLTSCLAGL